MQPQRLIEQRFGAFQCSSASRKFLNSGSDAAKTSSKTYVSVLFSEPKIPQLRRDGAAHCRRFVFQCSSASRKFLNTAASQPANSPRVGFSALQRAENSSIVSAGEVFTVRVYKVSVLFSEPKIPQYKTKILRYLCALRFSALQRAENSSINLCTCEKKCHVCFSALQRAENSSIQEAVGREYQLTRFSALQRAENSSMGAWVTSRDLALMFQCSSASRKFLNGWLVRDGRLVYERFQCSSASRKFLNTTRAGCGRVQSRGFSALQRAENSSIEYNNDIHSAVQYQVSVLFSEPKIPQLVTRNDLDTFLRGFSALQRAENSSMRTR